MATRKPVFAATYGTETILEEMAAADSLDLGGLTMSGAIAMGGNKITGGALPEDPNDFVTKAYSDAQAAGLQPKAAVKCFAVAAVTLSGLSEVGDGIDIDTDGDRVCAVAQADETTNGIWEAHDGVWTRPDDFDTDSHAQGAYTLGLQGTDFGGCGFFCNSLAPDDVVDTDDLTFVQFSGASLVTAGAGLQKLANEISVKKGDGIEVVSNTASLNIDLSTNPGLELNGTSPNKKLKALVASAGGVQIDGANGLAAKLNGATLAVSSSGLSVAGVPLNFTINGTATANDVTAANLATLTAGPTSDASNLHTHGDINAATKIENDWTVSEALAKADPAYISGNDTVGKADASMTAVAKTRVRGIARTATPSGDAPIVTLGPCAGALTGATYGTLYYLQVGGGIGTSAPVAGSRLVTVGWAMNATDLWVEITDHGIRAA